LIRLEYSLYLLAIKFPQVKHLTGISIAFYLQLAYKNHIFAVLVFI
jgi:hypothetical protein